VYEDLYKLGKENLNSLTCEYYTFSVQNSEIFDISHAFLPLTAAKLSTVKSSFFWPTLDIFMLAEPSGKRNTTVWRPSVSLSRRHTHRDSAWAAWNAASINFGPTVRSKVK